MIEKFLKEMVETNPISAMRICGLIMFIICVLTTYALIQYLALPFAFEIMKDMAPCFIFLLWTLLFLFLYGLSNEIQIKKYIMRSENVSASTGTKENEGA